MPIRINLKELFASDSQDITIDKVNFNFNKLLELGIGEQGLRGFSGIQGAAGPYGLTGPSGVRGASWFVDSVSDPNTLTFQDLLDGDFYLDSVNFGVWQWNGSSWDFIFNLANIINNYLAASPSPFTRGLGYTGTHASQDDRFIMFNSRSEAGDSLLGWSGNNASNDILFLNNFNETDIKTAVAAFQSPESTPVDPSNISTAKWYNSLLSVYVDHREETIGRYHLELGSLYNSPTSPSTPALTTVIENLKLRFLRNDFSLYSTHYNKALFSLDIPEVVSSTLRNTNAVFEFATPAYETSSPSYQTSTLLGSRFGLDEITGTVGDNLADGALFYSTFGAERASNIGIAMGYEIPNFPADTGYVQNSTSAHYFMLHNAAGVGAVYLNDTVLQDGGNIVQLGTTQPREIHVENAAFTARSAFYGGMGIAVDGDSIYTVAGKVATTASGFLTGADTKYGYLNKFSIENPNHPVSEYSSRVESATDDGGYAVSAGADSMATELTIGSAIADIDVVGEYAYVVNNQMAVYDNNDTGGLNNVVSQRTYFQTIELTGENSKGMRRRSRLGHDSRAGSTANYSSGDPITLTDLADPLELNCAWRVKVKGKHAIVATNGIHTRAKNRFGGIFPLGVISAGTEYTGGISAIDISDPDAPVVVGFEETGDLSAGWLSAVLDMKIIDDKAYTLAWEQDFDNGTPGSIDYKIHMHSFDLSGLDQSTYGSAAKISWYGRSSSPIVSDTGVPSPDLPNYGAIEVNQTFIFAGYEDTIYLFKRAPSSTASGPKKLYAQIDNFALDFTGLTSGVHTIYDMHQVGNSLYVLASASTAFNTLDLNTDSYYIFKLDISGLSQSSGDPLVTPTQVWVKELPGASTRFKVVGKHIYASVITSSSDDTDQPSLVAIDFDGIYASGAHIESLRADQVHTTRDLTVGGRLVVNDRAELGGGAHIEGNLGVAGDITAKMTHVVTTKSADQTILSNVTTTLSFPTVSSALLDNFPNNNMSYLYADVLNEWSGSTNKFTARNSGFYQFVLKLTIDFVSVPNNADDLEVTFIATPANGYVTASGDVTDKGHYLSGAIDEVSNTITSWTIVEHYQLEAGDTVEIEFTPNTTSSNVTIVGDAASAHKSCLYVNKLI
jgi:hypothetical protein